MFLVERRRRRGGFERGALRIALDLLALELFLVLGQMGSGRGGEMEGCNRFVCARVCLFKFVCLFVCLLAC